MPTTPYGLEYEILNQPVFSALELYLKPGQAVKAEKGAMIWMSPSLEVITKKAGKSLFGTLKRTLAGEDFFANIFVAKDQPGNLGLAPVYNGDIRHISVEPGKNWIVSGGAYIASTEGLDTSSKFQGFKRGFLSGERSFFLDAKPEGSSAEDLFLCSYGAFKEFDLKPNETVLVDTGNLVAMEGTATYDIRKISGGFKSLVLSGEGLLLEITGPGKVLAQTRAQTGFLSWIKTQLPGDNR